MTNLNIFPETLEIFFFHEDTGLQAAMFSWYFGTQLHDHVKPWK